MCFQKGHNWNDLPLHLKRGSCVVKSVKSPDITNSLIAVVRKKWHIENDIPIFTQDRDYIDNWLHV